MTFSILLNNNILICNTTINIIFFIQGLTQLYDFKQQYPEADVQPFLVKSHQFFQEFIEQGLKDIDQARKNQNLISQTNNQYSTGK